MKNKIPRKLSIVKFNYDKYEPKDHHFFINTFPKGHTFIFLGEVPNAKGHCVLATADGKIHFLYHTDDFIEVDESET